MAPPDDPLARAAQGAAPRLRAVRPSPSPTEPPVPALWRERAAVALVFTLAFAVYLASPVRRFFDPRYSLLAAESLITRGSWDLTPYFDGAVPQPDVRGERDEQGRPTSGAWQVARSGERLLPWYPPGTPLLAAPIVGALRLAGLSAVGPDGRFHAAGEDRLQAWVASLVAAATVVLLLSIARRELPLGPSVAIALLAAVGTSLWSIASRALWSHSFSALVLALAWLELLRWEDGERRRPAVLGALLAAGFWLRPTDALFAAGCALFVASRHRPALVRLVGAGAVGFVAFVALSWRLWGDWLPPYYRLETDAGLDGFAARLAGLLLSPARGLVAFTPALVLVPIAFARHGVPGERRAPLALATGLIAAHLVLYATWLWWWGGASYGPRLLTDLVPLFAWTAALAWRASAESRALQRPLARLLAGGTVIALLAWGTVAHGAGALSPRVTHAVRQASRRPADLWDWRRSPLVLLVHERDARPRSR